MSAALVVMYQRAESAGVTRTQLTRVGGLLQELNATKAEAIKGQLKELTFLELGSCAKK